MVAAATPLLLLLLPLFAGLMVSKDGALAPCLILLGGNDFLVMNESLARMHELMVGT